MNFMEIKKHYSTSIESPSYFNINYKLVEIIKELKPHNAFEFGANWGRNIQLLKEMAPEIKAAGIDLSKMAVGEARKLNLNVSYADERLLFQFPDNIFDVVFTCSVLNHIPDPEFDMIIKQLIRIGENIVLCESNDASLSPNNQNGRWFAHDYKKYGFKKLATLENPVNHGTNDFWVLTKEVMRNE